MKGIRKAPDRRAWDIAVVILGEVLANLMQQGHRRFELPGVGLPRGFHDLIRSVDQFGPAIVGEAGVGVHI